MRRDALRPRRARDRRAAGAQRRRKDPTTAVAAAPLPDRLDDEARSAAPSR